MFDGEPNYTFDVFTQNFNKFYSNITTKTEELLTEKTTSMDVDVFSNFKKYHSIFS